MRFRFWLAAMGISTLLAGSAFAQDELPDECVQAGLSTYDDCQAMLQGAAPAEEPVYEEPADEEPVYEEPAYEEPAPGQPVYDEPAADEPIYQEPEPVYDEPIIEEPVAEEPVYDEPVAEEPVYEEPAQDEPVYEEAAPEAPVYDEPVVEEPVYDEPIAEEPEPQPEPVYEEPAADEPVYDAPEEAVDEELTPDEPQVIEPEAVEEEPAAEPEPIQDDTEITEPVADDDLAIEDEPDAEPMATEALTEDDPIADLPAEELSTATEPLAEGESAEESAPLFDSAKDGTVDMEADTDEDVEAPDSDEAAQVMAEVTPAQIVEANAGPAEALAAAPQLVTPQNVTIINNVQNTYIYETNNTVIINNSYADRDRIFGDDDNTRFDQIGDNRFRETVYRDDGSVVVTTRDQYGNILERYRTDPDGDTYVLAYFDPAYYDDMQYWGDPGIDLPPLRITISIRDYALDWRYADATRIASFFAEPPLERARRIYSIDEVKRSARLRDSLRRLEVNDLNFGLGAASLNRNQVNALSRLAEAMWTLLEANPAETFLIEGHTDATGSDRDNLLLSDQRAGNVARILTQYYDIPPENLATQGYGERYLRIRTQRAEAQNRRVTIRRITPLVTPYFASR